MFKFSKDIKEKNRLLTPNDCPAGHWYAYDGDINQTKNGIDGRIFYIESWVGSKASVILIIDNDVERRLGHATWESSNLKAYTYSRIRVDLSNITVALDN